MSVLNALQLGYAGPREMLDFVGTYAVWLRASLAALRAFWAAYRGDARAAELLQTFSDRDLRDIGLCRADLRSIADGSYRCD